LRAWIPFSRSAAILCTWGPDVIRKEAWPFYRKKPGVRLCWELEEPKGPKGHLEGSLVAFLLLRQRVDAAVGRVHRRRLYLQAGSHLRLIDFVYHSTLGLRVIKKEKRQREREREGEEYLHRGCGLGARVLHIQKRARPPRDPKSANMCATHSRREMVAIYMLF